MSNLVNELIKQYEKFSDDELANIVKQKSSDYTTEAIEAATSLLKKREIERPSKSQIEKITEEQLDKESESESKYSTLRTISEIYEILAWVMGIGASIVIFYVFTTADDLTKGSVIIIYSLIAGIFGVLAMMVTSKGIKLFINMANDIRDIKENSTVKWLIPPLCKKVGMG